MKEGSSYSELVENFFSVMANDNTPSTLKITCRCPLFVTTTSCNYFLHEIKDDGSLEFAMATILNAPFVNATDLYIEKVDLNYDVHPIGEIMPLSGSCTSPLQTQCTPPYSHPLQLHKFSDPINHGRPVCLFGSTSRQSRRHKFGGISKNGQISSQPIPESMAGGGGGIDSDLNAEYHTGEDADS